MKLIARDRTLSLSIPRVMGILNVTPDSFSDGGKYMHLSNAIDHSAAMIADGADIIDVGGESTRPGADKITAEEEAERVVPVVEALSKRFDIFLSVDTGTLLVMRASVKAGAHLINDIRSFSEPGAIEFAAESQLPVCLMHMQGEPRTMQKAPNYKNILSEIQAYFLQQINRYEAAGIHQNRIVLDPGFGFGKTLKHNYQLLAHLRHFHHFGLPILVGMSRKSMIGQLFNYSPNKRITDSGSIACAVIAAIQGVNIIRVHDVRKTVEAIRVVEATLKEKKTYFN